jgi:hypothetical protein
LDTPRFPPNPLSPASPPCARLIFGLLDPPNGQLYPIDRATRKRPKRSAGRGRESPVMESRRREQAFSSGHPLKLPRRRERRPCPLSLSARTACPKKCDGASASIPMNPQARGAPVRKALGTSGRPRSLRLHTAYRRHPRPGRLQERMASPPQTKPCDLCVRSSGNIEAVGESDGTLVRHRNGAPPSSSSDAAFRACAADGVAFRA